CGAGSAAIHSPGCPLPIMHHPVKAILNLLPKGQTMAENKSILVLGAGELGMAVLRNLASRANPSNGATVSVLLRPSSIDSTDPNKKRDIDEIRSLGIDIVPGDLATASTAELAALFKRF